MEQKNNKIEKEETKYEGTLNFNLAILIPPSCKVILEIDCFCLRYLFL